MKIIVGVIIICMIPLSASAQGNFAKHMISGTSLTYIRYRYNDNDNYKEYTWNVNIAISVSHKMYIGMQLLNIYTNSVNEDNNRYYYYIFGLFSQYNILKQTKNRLFLELSINRGDYCTVSDIPIRKSGIYYLGTGIGFDWQFIKSIPNLYLDISLVAYGILNKIEDKYGYNQYVVGLNYRFGK